ncbi:MAG TPA: Holliday junction resolvase RuvX [Candidatus Doudnabacteria bacterium]|nr:Holliday junction resolvase RuvX [Candidatus Doudnabacteria bacterium]
MKTLGIDFGTKRIGLAISDELGMLARELVIWSPDEFWQQITGLITAEQVERIVVGLPLNMSGEETAKTEEVKAFAAKLKKQFTLPVVFADERLSSTMAEQIAGTSKQIDSLAAQIILQNFLNSLK